MPGLRRSEVASLAGVSVEYYARLERGQIAGASSGVLEALARALQLDQTERTHLFDLARAADGIPTSGRRWRRQPSQAASRLSLRWALEAITEPTTSVPTAPGRSASTIPSSASSPSPTRSSRSRPSPGLVLLVYTAEPGSP